VTAETDPQTALSDVDYIIHTIPMQESFKYLKERKDLIPQHVPIISASKGINSETLEYMDSVIPNALENPNQPTAFFSGPSFAKELVEKKPTAVVVASTNETLLVEVQKLFLQPFLRVYITDDCIGVEVGGALKNIYAIAAGIAEGYGTGMNSIAAIVCRGCHEMTKIAVKLGARRETLSGLSGIGDLMLTCYGSLSRNRSVGVRIGKGETIEQILGSMDEVAEGVDTLGAAVRLSKKLGFQPTDLPIIHTVHKTIYGETKMEKQKWRTIDGETIDGETIDGETIDGKLIKITPEEAIKYLMTLPVDYEIFTL